MKKLILLLTIILTSCSAPHEGSGYWLGNEDETFINASNEYLETYKNWIQAHNDKDIDAVLSYETEDVRLDLSSGTVISGAEAHREGLSNYFESNPEWNLYWALPYVGVTEGEVWIIAGQVVTTDDSRVQRMIDAQFTDGKISRVIVYDKTPPPPPPTEEGSDEESTSEE